MNSFDPSSIFGQWNLCDLLQRAGVVGVQNETSYENTTITSLTADSRSVKPGCCFVAIKGTHVDGHDFLESVVQAGAAAVVVENDVELPNGVAVVQVADTKSAFSKLSAVCSGLYGSSDSTMRLMGITGTNGKTTVAWILRSIFQAAREKTALIGTIEYDLIHEQRKASLTTPDALELCTLLATAQQAGATFGILEVSSHALMQKRCDGLLFSAAIFTNLSGDHLDYHGDMESYFSAKRRLFDGLEPNGTAIVNKDDPYGQRLIHELDREVVTYGIDSDEVDVGVTMNKVTPQGSEVVIHGKTFERELRLSLLGRHNISNALAAAATAEVMGVSADAIVEGLKNISGVPGRLQRVETDACPYSVLVDYAHTDAALENVLRALKPLTQNRLICVFGCGGDRDRQKRPRMAAAAQQWSDRVFVTSDNPRGENPEAIIEQILPGFKQQSDCQVEVEVDRKKAIEAAICCAEPGDTVLIAGKGHEDYQLVGDQVLRFDDVEVARACMEKLSVRGAVA